MFALVLCARLLYCLRTHVAKDHSKPAPKRRISKPKVVRHAHRTRKLVHWLLLFVASLIIVDRLVGERGLLAMMRARHQYDELTATIGKQRLENARLREEARRLTDDPNAIEEVARRDLGLIKPGERVFIVRDVQPAKP